MNFNKPHKWSSAYESMELHAIAYYILLVRRKASIIYVTNLLPNLALSAVTMQKQTTLVKAHSLSACSIS
jgi:hypothetical protein